MGYSSKSNFIAKLVESTNTELGVTYVVILGKSKATRVSVR
jgi:hypothetical protein